MNIPLNGTPAAPYFLGWLMMRWLRKFVALTGLGGRWQGLVLSRYDLLAGMSAARSQHVLDAGLRRGLTWFQGLTHGIILLVFLLICRRSEGS